MDKLYRISRNGYDLTGGASGHLGIVANGSNDPYFTDGTYTLWTDLTYWYLTTDGNETKSTPHWTSSGMIIDGTYTHSEYQENVVVAETIPSVNVTKVNGALQTAGNLAAMIGAIPTGSSTSYDVSSDGYDVTIGSTTTHLGIVVAGTADPYFTDTGHTLYLWTDRTYWYLTTTTPGIVPAQNITESGDTGNFLSAWNLTGASVGLWWELVVNGSTATVYLYGGVMALGGDPPAYSGSGLVAQGSADITSGATIALTERNNSGISGSVVCASGAGTKALSMNTTLAPSADYWQSTGMLVEGTYTRFVGGVAMSETVRVTKTLMSSGGGATPITVTVADSDNQPLDGVEVRISRDLGGSVIVAGPLYSNAFGKVGPFMLDSGTYYVWRQLAGYDFPQALELTIP